MRLVKENIETFTRGGDPYKKLGIGKYSDPQEYAEFSLREMGLDPVLDDDVAYNHRHNTAKFLIRFDIGKFYRCYINFVEDAGDKQWQLKSKFLRGSNPGWDLVISAGSFDKVLTDFFVPRMKKLKEDYDTLKKHFI